MTEIIVVHNFYTEVQKHGLMFEICSVLILCVFAQPQSYDAVDPVDVEEFLMTQLRSGDAELMQELGEFPDDDLEVDLVDRECRTASYSVPDEGYVMMCL